MDKRKEARQQVREKIVRALLDLMEEKSFSEITVTEIVARAGVARQSYYRNFTSKEEVVEEFFEELRQEGLSRLRKEKPADAVRWVAMILELQRSRAREILLLQRAGLGTLSMDNINRFAEEMLGDMPASSVERYKIYCHAGMVSNTCLTWLKNGAKEAPEELARIICEFNARDVLDRLDFSDL
ncbi:MAG: TetR family transcriptional regulator [Ruminiclostridium sp.]|nr:TetR family transcriptional regulator [Ruminiclostridium sp.]